MQASLLYKFSRDLAQAETPDAALEAAAARIHAMFRSKTSVFLGTGGTLDFEPTAGGAISERERAVATYAFTHDEAAGKFTSTLPESAGFYIPLRGSQEIVGVLIDGGTGIADSTRIFEKFVRGENSEAGGLGMGLSVARGFAEALGGTIWHQPRSDGRTGSVFCVKLPLATRSASVIESTP